MHVIEVVAFVAIAFFIFGYAFRGVIHGEIAAAGTEAKKIENEVKAKL